MTRIIFSEPQLTYYLIRRIRDFYKATGKEYSPSVAKMEDKKTVHTSLDNLALSRMLDSLPSKARYRVIEDKI